MSRASIIMFLNTMAEEGFVEYRDVSSKGGWKRLYRPSQAAPEEGSFRKRIIDMILEKVVNGLSVETE